MTQENSLLTLKGVKKSFGKNHVLRGVDIDVAKGESLVIIGGSGSGKSVMLKNALGLMTPDSGHVIFYCRDVTKARGKASADQSESIAIPLQYGDLV